MKSIQLTRGKFALVDKADFEWLSKFKWHCDRYGYARRNIYVYPEDGSPRTRGMEYMHRVILKTPPGMESDHVDGNKLNNQRSNLRICTKSQNRMNRRLQKNNSTGFRGVTRHQNGFRALIFASGKKYDLGCFKKPELASAAYQEAAIKYHGEFARADMSI